MPSHTKSTTVCDKWVWLKVVEFVLCVACVVTKRITDDETVRVHLILQRVSREWSLLRNVTWGRVGAALGDATYGGYTIITAGLLIARITREMPQGHRITEFFLLGLGAILFVLLASLELFGVDELPDNLIDNAIILGTLSMMTALLFLIDLAGPRKRSKKAYSQTTAQPFPFPVQLKPVPKPQDDIVKQRNLPQRETTFPATIETELITDWEPYKPHNRILTPKAQRQTIQTQTNGSIPNGVHHIGTNTTNSLQRPTTLANGHIDSHINPIKPPEPPAWMKTQGPRSPLQIDTELHSPIWSRYRAQAKSPVNLAPIKKVTTSSFLLPMPTLDEHNQDNSSPETAASSPIDPGFVQYAVDKWEEKGGLPKTPRHSPTRV